MASWRYEHPVLAAIFYPLFAGKDVKVEMRDHDHVVECVAWAPEVATQAINEAARDAAGGDNKNRSVLVNILLIR